MMIAKYTFSDFVGYGFFRCSYSHAFRVAVVSRVAFFRRPAKSNGLEEEEVEERREKRVTREERGNTRRGQRHRRRRDVAKGGWSRAKCHRRREREKCHP